MNVEILHNLVAVIAVAGVIATTAAGAFERKKLVLLAHLIVLGACARLIYVFVQMGDATYSALLTAVYMTALVHALIWGGIIEVKVPVLKRQQPTEG